MSHNDIGRLEKNLGITFREHDLLRRALTHRSYLNEHADVLQDNERLEFLGDAVLDFVVGAFLFRKYPEMREGELTALRAALVRSRTLAGFARSLNLGDHLRLGFGEAESGGRRRQATLCAAFEAVIGAIYLDQGLEPVIDLVERFAEPELERIRSQALHKDAKSEFQVWAQATSGITPHYELVSTTGPDHAKIFTVRAFVGAQSWGEGTGRSKQAAEQDAAAAALLHAQQTGL